MGPEALAQVLRPLTLHAAPPELLVGLHTVDDAAVYRVNDSQAVISTADFFPPVVDDPYAFGSIAAANALSDVYAMGGQPLMAINLVAWPDILDEAIGEARVSEQEGKTCERYFSKAWALSSASACSVPVEQQAPHQRATLQDQVGAVWPARHIPCPHLLPWYVATGLCFVAI